MFYDVPHIILAMEVQREHCRTFVNYSIFMALQRPTRVEVNLVIA